MPSIAHDVPLTVVSRWLSLSLIIAQLISDHSYEITHIFLYSSYDDIFISPVLTIISIMIFNTKSLFSFNNTH